MNRLRSGAALIIVLLILMALMLLGLPFLYSQIWSLSGARSLQSAQAARVYLLGAERLGAAFATYANTSAWRTTTGMDTTAQMHSALESYLADQMPLPSPPVLPQTPATPVRNIADIDAASVGWNHGPTVQIGLQLSDESGRLDPNLLDAAGWHDLFKKVNIPDWDDQEVQVTWGPNEGPDSDSNGELANELEWRRINSGRYQRLEDLRIAAPQQSGRRSGNHPEFRKRLNAAELERLRPLLAFNNRGQGRLGLTDLGSVVESDQSLAAQINDSRFKPQQIWFDISAANVNDGTYVESELNPGETAVEGIVRLGSQDAGFSNTIYYPTNVLPAKKSGLWLQVPPILNVNQVVPEIAGLPAYRYARQDPGGDAATEFPAVSLLPISWYGKPRDPDLPLDAALPWDYLQPGFLAAGQNALRRERQPLDLRSEGLVRMVAAATVVDAAGAIVAQNQRTSIVQAVPQENALERRWLTQGHFESLVAQRFTSGMTTWPRPTGRVTDVRPHDVDPKDLTAKPADESGLAFTVQRSPAALAWGSLPHLAIDWRVPLGTDIREPTADVLKDRRQLGPSGSEAREPPVETGGLQPPDLTQNANGEGLYPDGVRLGANNQLAYKFDATGGPLRMANVALTDPNDPTSFTDPSLAFRHIGMWFRPESAWGAGTDQQVITLMEARPHRDVFSVFNLAPDLASNAIPTANAIDQNYFGVFYDPKQNMLVVAYTPPSATAIEQPLLSLLTALDDNPLTPGVDERCMPGIPPGIPGVSPAWLTPPRFHVDECKKWSKTLQPNRIMTCWKFGRRLNAAGNPVSNAPEPGRWYHLQVAIGNGRPGGISLTVDGIVGTDVGLMSAKDYLASRSGSPLRGPWPGDHLTIPSLILLEDLPAIEKKAAVSAAPGTAGSDFYVAKIRVALPGFAPFASDDYSSTPSAVLNPTFMLPNRGSVLIGDEYIRYEDIKKTAGGTDLYRYDLLNCTRGVRQDTWATSDNLLERFPTTQAHRAGDRVITDGCRIPLRFFGPNRLYLGGSTLVTPFDSAPMTDENGVQIYHAITGLIQETSAEPRLFSEAITVIGAAWTKAPEDGFVLINDTENSDHIFFYKKNGVNGIILEDPAVTFGGQLAGRAPAIQPNSPTYWNTSTSTRRARVTLISLEVEDSANLLSSTYWRQPDGVSRPDTLLQLLGPDGWCEWLRYTDIIRRTDGGQPRAFFLNRSGWIQDPTSTARVRSQQRTAFRPNAYPATTTQVLPVQTSIERRYTKLLAPGDLVTLVPTSYTTAPPAVAVVRYCSNDGYGPEPDAINDTFNGWLGFTRPLEGLVVPTASYELVMGTGLNTLRDLTPYAPMVVTDLKTAALPRLDAHASGTDSGRLVLGGADIGRDGAVNPDIGGHGRAVMTIDAPYAGPWKDSAGRLLRVYGSTQPGEIAATNDLPVFVEADTPVFDHATGDNDHISLLEIGGEVFACELLTDADLATVIQAMTAASAAHPDLHGGQDAQTWLMSGNNRARVARLVGRALLGSTSLRHRFSSSPPPSQLSAIQRTNFGNLDSGPEFIRLPIGPVRYLRDPSQLVANDWFLLDDVAKNVDGTVSRIPTKQFRAPVALISEPVRSGADPATAKHEALLLIGHDEREKLKGWDPTASNSQGGVGAWIDIADNPNVDKWITAEWLRGIYNTPDDTVWATQPGGHGQLDPLVIGWWPRYRSSLPLSTKATPQVTPQHLTPQHFRSRQYNWINLPLRLHNARFHGDQPVELAFDTELKRVPNNSVLSDQTLNDESLVVELRAMAGSIDGERKAPHALGEGTGTQGDWSLHLGIPFTAWSATPTPVTGNLFAWNDNAPTPATAKVTDGVEVRISFRYKHDTTSDLSAIARNANRSPLLSAAKLRCFAPITTVSIQGAR